MFGLAFFRMSRLSWLSATAAILPETECDSGGRESKECNGVDTGLDQAARVIASRTKASTTTIVRNRIVENPHIDFAGYGKIGARKEPSAQKSDVVCKG